MNESPPILLIASSKMQRTPAFELAVALAKASGAELRILAVDFIRSLEVLGLFDHDTLTTLRESYLQSHRRWLEQQVRFERDLGLNCSVHVLWAERFLEEISDYVKTVQPSMLIKDVHHEPGFKRVFATPLDWHLLRECACPVQFVTQTRHALPQKVVAAVNLYRTRDADLRLNDRIIALARELAGQWGAKVHVLYAYDWSAIYASGFTMLGAMPIETGFVEALLDAHEEAFTSLCDRFAIEEHRRHFLTGVPEPTISAFARENDVDLLVMGTLPRHHLDKMVGNTAELLLAHAPCSVLIVKPEAAGVTVARKVAHIE
jgi:universal stress protein E